MHGIPYVLQEQNSNPGLTTRLFSGRAAQIHNGFPEAAKRLRVGRSTRVFDSGNPIEPPPAVPPDKAAAREAWGFPRGGGRVMLVYGGSQGSRAINETVAAWVRRGIPDGLFLIWSTGQGTHAGYASLDSHRVKVRAYLSPVADAYAAVDFALSRGGAIATAELCAWGIPPIVVPLPTAAADHQTANARTLAAAGAAEMIAQRDLDVDSLNRAVEALLADQDLLATRTAAVRARARPHAADEIAASKLELIASPGSNDQP
jgi:UDP-N-acetylglucosamine--N-acetylmuramyl-(pentapeptide) pyrophosphoryl-undecaprenol N-acetylglucosamine transferase